MAKVHRYEEKRGGAREGAGRPIEGSVPTQSISVTIPVDLLDAIEKEAHQKSESKSAVMARYLRKAMGKRGKKK